MNTIDNVFIKLQIQKDKQSGGLMLTINFDKNAPNFLSDTNEISWSPTCEELDFIIEMFGIISKRKNPEDKQLEEIRDDASHLPSDDNTEESIPESSEKKIATFEPLNGGFEGEKNSTSSNLEKKDDEKEIFVQVDDKTIDEVLKKKGIDVEEALILDKEEKGIIDRMVKKRGKYKDEL